MLFTNMTSFRWEDGYRWNNFGQSCIWRMGWKGGILYVAEWKYNFSFGGKLCWLFKIFSTSLHFSPNQWHWTNQRWSIRCEWSCILKYVGFGFFLSIEIQKYKKEIQHTSSTFIVNTSTTDVQRICPRFFSSNSRWELFPLPFNNIVSQHSLHQPLFRRPF